ncbi:putative ubiquitin carboxyl-terminal hydrolase MINDY-4 [Babylonia areolata]|uniref:putative ubiquitin carboxyl-terminal hydrolase MINDY-4 n=1 Tax=Babylonia areolata TaxID=304850 RepID=UPI003FD5F97C
MTPDNDFIESVTESVVREYLSRKGMKSTLQVMDQECPRRQGSISNRQMLMKELHLEKLVKLNKEQDSPLRAMLEVMTKFFLEKDPFERCEKEKGTFGSDFSSGSKNMVKQNPPSGSSDKYLTPLARPTTAALSTRRGRNDHEVLIDDELDSETLVGDGKMGLLTREASEDGFSRTKVNRPLSAKTKTGAIISTMDDSASRRRVPKSKTTAFNTKQAGLYPQRDSEPARDFQSGSNGLGNSSSSDSFWGDLGLPQGDVSSTKPVSSVKPASSKPDTPKTSSFQELLSAGEQKASQLSRRLSEKSETSSDSGYSVNTSSFGVEKTSSRPPASSLRSGSSAKPSSMKVGDLEVGDVDDFEDELNDVQLQPTSRVTQRKQVKQLDSKPIDTHTAIALKLVVFGSSMQYYNDEWRLQSFAFCDLPDLQYGIVQKKGGPCGVLAAVQAVVLQEMLFGEDKLPQGSSLKPSRNERTKYLALALARIFWRAGEHHRAVVAMPSNQTYVMGSSKFRQDEVTEMMMLYTFTSFADLVDFMKDSVKQYEMDGNPGVVLAMCSTILSRGIDRVKKDMDEVGGKLMGAHGYCTQELVNLLLTGEAVSNVFNDVMELDSGTGDSMVLRGVSARSDIGLMSLFEHYKSCQVGTYLKTPKYPIWVVCSESHFSVLFSVRLDLMSDWKAERRFDLFYYDGLARQQEEIKLTIYTTNASFRPPVSEEDLVPPLEHCIRTKWPGAEIDWNGYEPIL